MFTINIRQLKLAFAWRKRMGARSVQSKSKLRESSQNVVVGGNVEGNLTVNHGFESLAPDVRLDMYGAGSTLTFRGSGFASDSGRQLYLVSVEIAGLVSAVGMSFVRRLPIDSISPKLSWPPDIFTELAVEGKIPISFVYQTTDGRSYRQVQYFTQEPRVGDAHFNLRLDGPIQVAPV